MHGLSRWNCVVDLAFHAEHHVARDTAVTVLYLSNFCSERATEKMYLSGGCSVLSQLVCEVVACSVSTIIARNIAHSMPQMIER